MRAPGAFGCLVEAPDDGGDLRRGLSPLSARARSALR
jgi:hypothetical protein